MNNVLIFGGAGAILSVIVAYVPGAKQAYEKLEGPHKQIVNLGLLAAFVAGAYLLSYLGYVDVFDPSNPWEAVVAFGTAMIANAGTYKSFDHIKKGE